ncbi:MAG: hypothetical protein V1794_11555 [Candidatus Glassbacteria bacterium]
MKRDTITVVLVSENRTPLTIEFSIRELLAIVMLILTLAGGAVYSIFNFRSLKTQHAQLTSTVDMLEAELAEREQRIAQLRQSLEASKGLVLLVNPPSDTARVTGDVLSAQLRLENIQTTVAGNRFYLDFNLVKAQDDSTLASGFLIVIAEHTSGEIARNATFPEIALQPGQSVNFRQGDWYSIKNFKVVQAQIQLKDRPENYPRLNFMVFDSYGGLVIHYTKALDR